MSITAISGNHGTGYYTGICTRCTNQDQAQTTGTPDTVAIHAPIADEKNKAVTNEEQKQVAKLKQRDREVRTHEAAHIAAGGGVVRGGASFSYQSGPDGKRYAIGGEVGIDTSPVKDNPEATIQKMQRVRAAALAPANPSGQDRAVASAASAQAAAARRELSAEKSEENVNSTSEKDKNAGAGGGKELYSERGRKQEYQNQTAVFDVTV